MLKHLTAIIVILSLIASNISCTKIVNIPISEAVGPSIEIVSITLKSGEEVKFKDKSGRFNKSLKILSGLTVMGRPVEYKLKNIKSINYKETTDESNLTMTIKAKGFCHQMNDVNETHIVGLVTNSGKHILFYNKNASVDKELRLVKGIDRGLNIEVAFDEIKYIQLEKGSSYTLIPLIIGAVVFASMFMHDLMETDTY